MSQIIEVCVDSVRSAINAQDGGADRLEVCQDLIIGGTTPSLGLVEAIRDAVDLPLVVMIRPRAGDFCYDDGEFAVMQRDIRAFQAQGVKEVVTGILTADGHIDVARMRQLIAVCHPMKVVIHRAFDMTIDMTAALEAVRALGIKRILSSGGQATVDAGAKCLIELSKSSADTVIMPGSGVNSSNAEYFKDAGFREIHLSATSLVDSVMRYRNSAIQMGCGTQSEYSLSVCSAEKVRAVAKVFKNSDGD